MGSSLTAPGRSLLLPIALAAGLAASAHAQWTVVPLHPTGAVRSWVESADGATQAGFMDLGGVRQAVLWHGTANPVTPLHPAGATESAVNGAHLGHQAGYAIIGGRSHAAFWNGSAASWIDLHPPGAAASELLAVWGDVQGGTADINGLPRAGLWHGAPDTFADLTPAGADAGRIEAIHRDTQVGYCRFGFTFIGGLWHGAAASWVPLGANTSVYAVYGNQQGGIFPGNDQFQTPQACFWEGTEASRVDINMLNGAASGVLGMGRGRQVGFANVSAAIWSSTRESRLDLHQFLPAPYRNDGRSQANAISFDQDHTYVVGLAIPFGLPGEYRAFLWIGPPSPCFVIRPLTDILFCPRSGGSFTVSPTGYDGTPTYQWLKDGVPIALADNPTAHSATLEVAGAAAAGRYSCIVTDLCGSITSDEAVANVCAADVNCDNFLDFFDYDDFVAAFESGDPIADFNADGFLDFFDYNDFVDAFEQAC